MLANELFASALRSLENFVSVNYNLCGKLASSSESPITFNARFKVTSVTFFTPDFDLLICELNNFTFSVTLSHFVLI